METLLSGFRSESKNLCNSLLFLNQLINFFYCFGFPTACEESERVSVFLRMSPVHQDCVLFTVSNVFSHKGHIVVAKDL